MVIQSLTYSISTKENRGEHITALMSGLDNDLDKAIKTKSSQILFG